MVLYLANNATSHYPAVWASSCFRTGSCYWTRPCGLPGGALHRLHQPGQQKALRSVARIDHHSNFWISAIICGFPLLYWFAPLGLPCRPASDPSMATPSAYFSLGVRSMSRDSPFWISAIICGFPLLYWFAPVGLPTRPARLHSIPAALASSLLVLTELLHAGKERSVLLP